MSLFAPLLVVLSLPQTAGPAELRSDAKLNFLLELRTKNSAVGEVVAEIDKQTDKVLTIAPNIANLKVTAFVKDQPCSMVMEKMADVLGCEWTAEDGGYRLIQAHKAAAEMKTYLAAEDRLLQKHAKTDIDELVQETATPLEELQARLRALKESGASAREVAAERNELLTALDDRKRLAGDLFRGLAAPGWTAFWRGQVLAAEAPGKTASDNPLRIAVMFDTTLQQTVFRTSKGPEGALTGFKLVVRPLPYLKPPEPLADLPFSKAVLSWPTPEEQLASAQALKKPLNTSKLLGNDGRGRRTLTLADYLEEVFEQTKLPCVAEGFRSPAGANLSQISTIEGLVKTLTRYDNHQVSLDSDWLLVRHGGFWRKRLSEIPESQLRSLEETAKSRPLKLDDYADFATKLTRAQALSFRVGFPPSVDFSTLPLTRAMPALRFYGALSARQRRGVLAGTPISAGSLTAIQRQLFQEALSASVFANADDLSWQSGLLSGDFWPENLFFTAQADMVYPQGKPLPGGRIVNGQASSPMNQKVEGTVFAFGLSPERRVGYSVPVAPGGARP